VGAGAEQLGSLQNKQGRQNLPNGSVFVIKSRIMVQIGKADEGEGRYWSSFFRNKGKCGFRTIMY
jgi:hypothetical protein